MDPREKREDESWAEYGARMAAMGIEPSTPQSVFTGAGTDVAYRTINEPGRPRYSPGIPWGEAFLNLGAPIDDPNQLGKRLGLGLGAGGAIAAAAIMANRDKAGPDYGDVAPSMQDVDYSAALESAAGVAGTQTGMPVAMDAGGAVGGYPTVDYSQMAQDWADPSMMLAPAFEQPDLSQPVSTENLAYTGMPSVFGRGTQVAATDSNWTSKFGIPYSTLQWANPNTPEMRALEQQQTMMDAFNKSGMTIEEFSATQPSYTPGTGPSTVLGKQYHPGSLSIADATDGQVRHPLDMMFDTPTSPADILASAQVDTFADIEQAQQRTDARQAMLDSLQISDLSDPTSGIAATDPNLQGMTPFSMVNATGNLAGYGTSPYISQIAHVPSAYYDDISMARQVLADEDAAAAVEDFSDIAPVTGTSYSRYLQDPTRKHGKITGPDYVAWMQEQAKVAKATPTMERVREQEAIAAGNVAAKTAGGLDKIARDRIANQEAIERKMREDTARINQKREDAARALEDSRNLARKKEEEETRKATAWVFEERRLEEAAARTEVLAVEKAEAQAVKDRVRQAREIMNSRAWQEGPSNVSQEKRDIVAAAQVDTFNEITARATRGAGDRASVGIDVGGQVGTSGKYGGGGPR